MKTTTAAQNLADARDHLAAARRILARIALAGAMALAAGCGGVENVDGEPALALRVSPPELTGPAGGRSCSEVWIHGTDLTDSVHLWARLVSGPAATQPVIVTTDPVSCSDGACQGSICVETVGPGQWTIVVGTNEALLAEELLVNAN